MRLFLVLVLMLFAVSVFAIDNCCLKGNYDKNCCAEVKAFDKEYKTARLEAKASKDADLYIVAVKKALLYDNKVGACWQYINASKMLINEYASQCEKEKDKGLLEKAKNYLLKAQQLDDGKDKERTRCIDSNFGYVDEHFK